MAITASEARKNLFPLIDRVNDDQEPVEIVSRRGSAYLVSESQFRSLMETAYLLRSPANASRLLGSIAALEKGAGRIRDLVDADVEPAALAEPSEATTKAAVTTKAPVKTKAARKSTAKPTKASRG